MRFFSALLASIAVMASTTSAATLPQMLASSYIADLTTVDTNTDTTMQSWKQFHQVTRDDQMIQTSIMTKQWQNSPFNQTILYEQAKLSGTGGSAKEGPIAEYRASSYAPALTGPGRVWTSCEYKLIDDRQPNYCTEIAEVPSRTYQCGRDKSRTCTLSEVACRVNSVIQPSQYYMVDSTSGEIVQQMESKDATQVTYWSNLNSSPTAGQFGDVVLLPQRDACPDNNTRFPATFGTAPIAPGTTPGTPTTSTGSMMPTTDPRASTGVFYSAASSLPSFSTLVAILPAIVMAALKL
jgi:hypothetical protein